MEHPNGNIIPNAAPKPSKLDLKYLPAYAAFLLQHHLEDFVVDLIRTSREEEVPLLKYFSSYSEKDLVAFGIQSNTDLLTLLAENKLEEFVQKSTTDFVKNQLPIIDREAIIAEDITIISLVRRRVFRNFLYHFTTDLRHFSHVMEDVDRFTAAIEAAAFNAYSKIQQEKINRIHQELELQHEELLEAQNLAEMGSFFWDIKNGHSTYTPGALRIFGLTGPNGLDAFLESVHPPDRPRLLAAIDKALKQDGLYECEYTYSREGQDRRIWSRGNVLFAGGAPVSMKGTVMDITNEYRLLERLQHSENLHKQAQTLTHIGNWSWNIQKNKIIWSDEMYRIYGLEPQSEEITFDRFMSLVHPDDREKRQQEIQQSLQTGEAADYLLRIINPGGAEKMLKGKGEIIKDIYGQPLELNGTCQDITKEYLLNKELQEKEQNYSHLINNAPDAVIVINSSSVITLWNPKTTAIFGWTSEEVIGKQLSETIIPERYREAHKQGMKRFLDTGEAHILNKTLELTACNKNGEEFYISITISQTTQMGATAFIAFIRDISEQKNIQLELQKKTTLLEYKNLQLERINEELESFNFAASHDLQEPLRKIHTYGSRITDRAKSIMPPPVLNDFEKILGSAARMQKLLEDLLSFSQNTLKSQDAEPVDLNAMIGEVKNSFINDVEEKLVQIHMATLPIVKVVRFQFLQLFINLLTNAIKYQQENVPPEINISAMVVGSNGLQVKGMLPGKNYLRISVTDNGIGFEQEYAEKIFDLFTRLHSGGKYSGTGIGLATCKKIIHNHEGFITAESTLGKGATFFIYLPEESIVHK
ncbi:MAG: PAS domain S-box protein [Bacteroidota bacterium]